VLFPIHAAPAGILPQMVGRSAKDPALGLGGGGSGAGGRGCPRNRVLLKGSRTCLVAKLTEI
jgi:hypothetical protein